MMIFSAHRRMLRPLRLNSTLLLALLLSSVIAGTGCVKQDDIHALQMQLNSQNKHIKDLKQQQTSNQAQITEVRPTQANLWAEMEGLRMEIARLGGRMDEVERMILEVGDVQSVDTETLAQLKDEMEVNRLLWQEAAATLALDLEAMEHLSRRKAGIADPQAEQKAEAGIMAFAANATVAGTNATLMNATFGNGTQGIMDNGMQEMANNATQTAVNAAQPTAVPQPELTDAQKAAQAIAPGQPKAAAADILYQQALTRFKSRDYATAQRLWQEFSETFKKHRLIANSLFWQGECFFQLKNYARAVLAYQEVISRYPNSSKYPSALLKQGLSFLRLGKKQAGELLLKDVVRKFPESAEATRAKELLKK